MSTTGVSEQLAEWLIDFQTQDEAEPWLQEIRSAAFFRFTDLGFPTTHNEEWRFTNVAPIARTNFRNVLSAPSVIPEAARKHLAKYAPQDHPFVALNTAFLNGVTVHQIPAGAIVEDPIEINYEVADQAGPPAFHPRTLLIIGADAHCTIVERYSGSGRYLTNAVTEVVCGDRAVVDHYRVQQESLQAFHIGTLQAKLGRSANFSTHNISLGAALARFDTGAVLSEGTEAVINGLYIVGGTQHVDNHTVIDHAMPHGASHELYKGILDGQAHAVFNGRIIVRPDAQKTDSKQTNKNLVLSDDAVIDTKPELQIHADDVRCTHGATIGQLDAESMFYLQSRGIGKSDARSLLTYAFAQDIVDRIKVQSLRDSLERSLFEKFHDH
ncbi:MAG TPA: Fe-S cluster assembly protein SufD [Verrucomicrobiae bacterium]|nr:Fe-S cluster assembly protein SufD [Verrucomicrobiae bacterium]